MHSNSFFSSHVDSKLKNGIPENMEIPYIICPHTIVCIHSKVYIKYTPLDLVHQKFVVRYTPHLS